MDGGGLSTVALFGLDETTTLYLGLSVLALGLGAFVYLAILRGGGSSRKIPTIGLERVKVGFIKFGIGFMSKKRGDSDYHFKLNDGRDFVVPKEKVEEAEIVQVPKDLKIKKGTAMLFPIENGQLTHFNGSLTEQTNPLLDNESVSAVQNRGSLRVLARLTGALGGGYTMIILAGAAAFAIGYILYPQFNHAAPIVEYCQHFANGTITGCTLTP